MKKRVRKAAALALGLVMIMAALAGCGESAKEQFDTLVDEMNKAGDRSYEVEALVSIESGLLGEDASAYPEGITLTVSADGWISVDSQRSAGDISMNMDLGSSDVNISLGDYILDGNKLYYNIKAAYDSIATLSGESAQLSLPDGVEYMVIDGLEGSFSQDAAMAALPEVFTSLGSKVSGYIDEQDLYSEGAQGALVFSMEKDDLVGLTKVILQDIGERTEDYYTQLVEYMFESQAAAMQEVPYSEEELLAQKDQMVSSLSQLVDQALAALEESGDSIPDMNLTCAVAKGDGDDDYTMDMLFEVPEYISLGINQKYSAASEEEMAGFAVPENALTQEDLTGLGAVSFETGTGGQVQYADIAPRAVNPLLGSDSLFEVYDLGGVNLPVLKNGGAYDENGFLYSTVDSMELVWYVEGADGYLSAGVASAQDIAGLLAQEYVKGTMEEYGADSGISGLSASPVVVDSSGRAALAAITYTDQWGRCADLMGAVYDESTGNVAHFIAYVYLDESGAEDVLAGFSDIIGYDVTQLI